MQCLSMTEQNKNYNLEVTYSSDDGMFSVGDILELVE